MKPAEGVVPVLAGASAGAARHSTWGSCRHPHGAQGQLRPIPRKTCEPAQGQLGCGCPPFLHASALRVTPLFLGAPPPPGTLPRLGVYWPRLKRITLLMDTISHSAPNTRFAYISVPVHSQGE